MQESRRDTEKQHNKIKNRIKALDSSLELGTVSSFTTFIVEGKVSCTGVESTNTTSGSHANLMERLRNEQLDSLVTIALHVLFQGKCHIRLSDVWRGQKADRVQFSGI